MTKSAVLAALDKPVIFLIQIKYLFAFLLAKSRLLSSKNSVFEFSDVTAALNYA